MCVVADRTRPRSTRINKRFLSRTVASAAHSRPNLHHSTTAATSSGDEETQRAHSKQTALQQQQQQPSDVSADAQRCTGQAVKRRKHSADDSSNSCSDCGQANFYDVHEYMTLNRQYRRRKN